MQSRNLNSVFRTKKILQTPESVLLITILDRITNKSFTEKQSIQTRVSRQKIKIETANKKSESEDIANIVSFLFTEKENLNPIMVNKKT